MEHSILRTSFNPISHQPPSDHPELQQECRRIIKENQKIEIGKIEPHFISFPYLLRLILSIYYTLAKKLHSIESSPYEYTYFKNPISTHLKYSLLKLLANIIQKKLFVSAESNKLYDQLSLALVFKQCLFSLLLSILSENSHFVTVEKLINFYQNLTSERYSIFLPVHVYHLYGGGHFTIEARTFREKLASGIEALGKVLSASETIISRNIEYFKKDKQRKKLLEESLKMVVVSKNKEALMQLVQRITSSIFISRQYLSRQEFLVLMQSKPVEPTLTLFLRLARSEAMLFQERSFKSNLLLRNEITKTNFYTNEISKLFNKCPFNGDERCDCKKCSCVRRNRESAKANQEMKRNAVERVEELKVQVEELEKRDKDHEQRLAELQEVVKSEERRAKELQEENLMLRSLITAMKANPNLKLLMMQTIEPVSKVLNNDL